MHADGLFSLRYSSRQLEIAIHLSRETFFDTPEYGCIHNQAAPSFESRSEGKYRQCAGERVSAGNTFGMKEKQTQMKERQMF